MIGLAWLANEMRLRGVTCCGQGGPPCIICVHIIANIWNDIREHKR